MTSRLQARGKHFYPTKQFSWHLRWSTSLHLSSLERIDAILGQFSRASTISEMKWLGSLRLVCFHELWWILLSLTRAGGKPGNQMIIDHLFGFSWYTGWLAARRLTCYMTWSPGSNADNGSAAKVLWQASRLDSGKKLEGPWKNDVKYIIVVHFSLILWDWWGTCEHGNLYKHGAKCLQHRLQKDCTWVLVRHSIFSATVSSERSRRTSISRRRPSVPWLQTPLSDWNPWLGVEAH